MNNLKMIVCVSKNWGIGKNGDLLFSLPKDMKFFRETTSGAAIVMGRKTLDSFPNGAPLKNRVNIVLTNNHDFSREGAIICHTKEEVLNECKKHSLVFVIGGGAIYDMFLENCDTAYITKVDAVADADTFIKNLDTAEDWNLFEESEPIEDNGYIIKFCKFQKRG